MVCLLLVKHTLIRNAKTSDFLAFNSVFVSLFLYFLVFFLFYDDQDSWYEAISNWNITISLLQLKRHMPLG